MYVQRVSYSEWFLEEYYTKAGVLRFLLASWPWDTCSVLHRAVRRSPYTPLEFPSERKEGKQEKWERPLPWPTVKDHQCLQCVRGARLQSAQPRGAARRDVVNDHPSAVLMFERLEDTFSSWAEARGRNAYVILAGVWECCCLSRWLVASPEHLGLPKEKQKSTSFLW